ncbi:hypothetical protein VTN96DRAFT_3512 [Rasamsonia emersonii]|uniref:CN hydrolase domain-containing protein n=1 Tax=Rasamsonia emersonii (strain ATCC 16479 / CBS 393.64 / IMI 116815) TaxID=1408163 RepID=A0A0F4YSZ2_RASE3|nr:hypothetical protein T310_5008 [Rasamsonia emersonii CBS 393.64]KKA20971.1 hypothetical protein T310_5008 [Rasamsonia emersonii CBS 393.64]
MPSAKFRAAAVHATPEYMNKAATTTKVLRLIEQAAQQSITLLVFPEVFIPGFPYFINCYPPLKQVDAIVQYRQQSVAVDGEEIAQIRSACRAFGVSISLGISERMSDGRSTLFNSQVFIDTDGTILGVHRKIQPTFAERYLWGQGDGWTLRTFDTKAGYKLGGLCCWEHTINGARQALIADNQHVHAAAWPSLSTLAGFEDVADTQIEALMKTHALTAQVFVICASNYVDESCLQWLRKNLGETDLVKAGGGWSAIIHPFCAYLAGPVTGEREELLTAEIDLSQLEGVKLWLDGAGHSSRPEILQFSVNRRPVWADEKEDKTSGWTLPAPVPNEDGGEKSQ